MLFAVVIQVVGLLRGLAKRRQVAQVENRVAAFLAQFAFFQGGEVVVVVCGGGGLRPAGEAEVVGDEGMAFAVADECGDFAALRDGGDGRATFRFEGEGERCGGFAFFADVAQGAVFSGGEVVGQRQGGCCGRRRGKDEGKGQGFADHGVFLLWVRVFARW